MPQLSVSKFALLFILAAFTTRPLPLKAYVVGISQIVEHPSLNEIRQGLIEGLQKAELGQKVEFRYLNAQGDSKTSAQIAHKLIGDRADVVVGISTPSTQHLLAKKSSIPVVFAGVNDPISARLVKNLDKPGGQVTGVMLISPIEQQLALMVKLKHGLKRVGIMYNAGEDNSVFLAKQFHEAAAKLDLKDVPVTINSSSQVQAAVQALAGKVDAIYLPTDNTVISALGAILQVSKNRGIPVFTADLASAEQGAIAALGLDHYELGLATAEIVSKILRGSPAGEIPVARPDKQLLVLNLQYADDRMGLLFPPSILKQAKKILK